MRPEIQNLIEAGDRLAGIADTAVPRSFSAVAAWSRAKAGVERGSGIAGPKARTTDPGTAKLAALHSKPRAGSQRQRLYAAVGAAGPRGLTAEEAAAKTGIRLNSASTRMSELVRGSWLAESQGGTRLTSGGEQAIVYVKKREMAEFVVEVADPQAYLDAEYPCEDAHAAALKAEDLTSDADSDEVAELLASGDPDYDVLTWTDDESGRSVTVRRVKEGA